MIAIIVGTNRLGSLTRKVALQVRVFYEELGEEVRLLDLAELPAALFEPAAYAEKPPAFQPFVDTVLEADGLVVVTPEYNGGFPGVLKYFIDMLPFPESFENRPVCFVGLAAGHFGALRPVEQLQQIFGHRRAWIHPLRVFMTNVRQSFDEDGRVADEVILSRLRDQASAFSSFVRSCGGEG